MRATNSCPHNWMRMISGALLGRRSGPSSVRRSWPILAAWFLGFETRGRTIQEIDGDLRASLRAKSAT